MRIQAVQLEHFRNYQRAAIQFEGQITILEGRNAMGKSNLLEAIALLSVTKSVRAVREELMVQDGSAYARVVGSVQREGRAHEIVCAIERSPGRTHKKWRVQGAPSSPARVLSLFPLVLFQPDDLDTLLWENTARREWLDTIVMRTQPLFRPLLQQLTQILQQRRAAFEQLQQGHSVSLRDFNEQLVTLSAEITQVRARAIQKLQPHITEALRVIGQADPITVRLSNAEQFWDAQTSLITLQKHYQQQLELLTQREQDSGRNLVGAQRDEIVFSKAHRLLREVGSRGEWRSLVLALKRAELSYLHEHLGERPVLLLDDVLSELDVPRRAALVPLLAEQQTIITTTHRKELPQTLIAGAQVRTIVAGTIQQQHYATTA